MPKKTTNGKKKNAAKTGPKNQFRLDVDLDLRLYADFDQSGAIAETTENYDKRLVKPGGILFSECLPATIPLTTFTTRMDGGKIVDAAHLKVITPLKLVHAKGLKPADKIIFKVTPAHQKKIKLYDGYAIGANALVGRGIAKSKELRGLATSVDSFLLLGIAAATPAAKVMDTITLNLEVTRQIKGVTKVVFKDSFLFTIAPWLMPPSTADIIEAYVIQADPSLVPVGNDDGKWPNTQFRVDLLGGITGTTATLKTLVPGDGAGNKFKNGNRWTQDMFEFGVQTAPGRNFSILINSANSESRVGFGGVWEDMLASGHGVFKQPQFVESSLDSFGNLEVTPPLPSFPLGKKYHGFVDAAVSPGHIDAGVEFGMFKPVTQFLDANAYQPVTQIATNWLAVGHVDEFLAIVPYQGKVDEFRVLYASPQLGIDLVTALQTGGLGANEICEGIDPGPFPGYDTLDYIESIDDFLDPLNPGLELNTAIESRIQKIIAQLVTDWGIPKTSFLPIPTLFNGTLSKTKRLYNCIARTAGMVNGLVVGHTAKRMIMPSPFGPLNAANVDVFEQSALDTLKNDCDMDVEFIDDWTTYHILMGEVHCGTNCQRQPPVYLNTWWDPKLKIKGKPINS
jgi:hypothetical protein